MSFDAYNIAIRLSAINAVSPSLQLLSRQFGMLDAQALAFQKRLSGIKSLMMTGGVMFGVGAMGLGVAAHMTKPLLEYEHQLNILKMAGLSQLDIAKATAAAWKTSRDVMTSAPTGNLKSFLDMRNILGDTQEAIDMMPMVAKMQAVLLSSKEGKVLGNNPELASDFAFSVAKALDIIGATGNKEEFTKQATEMAKVITATQGRVTPKMMQSTFAFSRQGRYAFNDEFKYKILPTLIMEYSQGNTGGGGGSKGVGPGLASLFRVTNQGYINKKSIPLLEKLELIDPNSITPTATPDTYASSLKESALAASNPFKWTQDVLMPAIHKAFGDNLSTAKIQEIIGQAFRGPGIAASVLMEFAIKPKNFERDANIVTGAMELQSAYNTAIKADPALGFQMMESQWEAFQVALTLPLANVIMPALSIFTEGLQSLSEILIKYPNLAKLLSYSFIGLMGALAFSGLVLLLTGAFKGLALVLQLFTFLPAIASGINMISVALTGFSFAVLTPFIPLLGVAAGIGLVAIALWKIGKFVYQLQDWGKILTDFGNKFNFLNNIIGSIVKASFLGELCSQLQMLYKLLTTFFPNLSFTKDIQAGVDKISNIFPWNKDKNNYMDKITGNPKSPMPMSPIAPRDNNKPLTVNTSIHIDKRKIAHAVSKVQAQELSSVPNYISRTDYNMHPVSSVTNLKNIG